MKYLCDTFCNGHLRGQDNRCLDPKTVSFLLTCSGPLRSLALTITFLEINWYFLAPSFLCGQIIIMYYHWSVSLTELPNTLRTSPGTHLWTLKNHPCASPRLDLIWLIVYSHVLDPLYFILYLYPHPTAPGFSSKRFLTTTRPLAKDKSPLCQNEILLILSFVYLCSLLQKNYSVCSHIFNALQKIKGCWHHNPSLREDWGRRAGRCSEGFNKKRRLNAHNYKMPWKKHPVKEMLGFMEGAFAKGQERQRSQQMKTGKRGHGHMHGHGGTEGVTEDWWKETGRWDWKGRARSYSLNHKARCLYLSTQVRGIWQELYFRRYSGSSQGETGPGTGEEELLSRGSDSGSGRSPTWPAGAISNLYTTTALSPSLWLLNTLSLKSLT